MRVVVGVPTTGRRPLRFLLDAFTQLDREGLDIRFVVVHNAEHESRSLREQVEAVGARYVHESRRGYASVRNRMLELGRGHEWLVMIDDDELPAASWLVALLGAAQRFDADVAVGPVRTEVVGAAWLDGGALLRERTSHPVGDYEGQVAANNTAVRVAFLQDRGLTFDPRFNAGGEDTDFFARCRRAGAKVVWVPEAEVVEGADAERLTKRWVLRRAFREGRLYGRESERFGDSRRRLAPRKVAQMGRGLGRLLIGGVFRQPATSARGARDLASATGTLEGLCRATLSDLRRGSARRASTQWHDNSRR